MVAGRRLWGRNEERAAQHQAGGGGDLGVEAVIEDRFGAGEAGGLDTRIEADRQIDEEDDREADKAEHEDDPSQAPSPFVAHRDEGQEGGEQRDGNQHECVRLAGGLHVHRRRACRRQSGIAQLVDFNRAVVDELCGDKTGRCAEDREADRPLRGEYGADTGSAAPRPGGRAQQPPFD